MGILRKLTRIASISLGLILLLPTNPSHAVVQTLVDSGVTSMVDGLPAYLDPVVMWVTSPSCFPPGFPGNELFPARITRASLSIATPRVVFDANPPRLPGVCNPYLGFSNVFAFNDDLYFVDNPGDGTYHGLLRRLRRDANPGDEPQLIADLGVVDSARILVTDDWIFVVISAVGDRIAQYNRITGEVIDAEIEFTADRLTIKNLRYDGRFLYWINHDSLHRYDLRNGGATRTVVDIPVTSFEVVGYQQYCDLSSCYELSRIVYAAGRSGGRSLFEAETISGSPIFLYESANLSAEITDITLDAHNYYFIEARPTGEGHDVDGRIYRVSASDHVADLIYGPVFNGGSGLTGLRTDLTWLYFADRDEGSILRLSNDEAAIPVHDLSGTRLEITQGIQDAAQSVRLIANKRTLVRFYVKSELNEDVYGATAVLTGSNSLGDLGRLEPINLGGKLITVRHEPTRLNLDHSFQFELPANWTTGGQLTLRAYVNPDMRLLEDDTSNNRAQRTVDFTPSERLLVIYYNFNYDLDGVRYSTSFNDVVASRQYMRRVYPLAQPGPAFESPGLHVVVFELVDNNIVTWVDRTNTACTKNHSKAEDRNLCASDYAHARLRALRQGSGIAADTVSYANIAQAMAPMGKDYFTRGYALGQFASGPSDSVDYASHEVGHTLGRNHPSKAFRECGHSNSDPDYPYENAGIASVFDNVETRPAGLDFDEVLPGGLRFLTGSTNFDFMSYCNPSWISDYTFEGIYQYLISPTRPRARTVRRTAVPGDWLFVSGTLTPDEDAGGFVLIQRMASVTDASPPAGGSFTLQMRNAAGTVLASQSFAGEPIEEQPGTRSFNFVMAFVAGTTELRIIDETAQRILATQRVTAHAPSVTNVQLQSATNPVDGIVPLTWSAADEDGDRPRFDVFARRSDESSFRPIHLGVTGNSVDLDTTMLGGGENVLRIVASDGVNTASAESAAFVVAPRPPRIAIVSPVDGFRADWGQLLTFEAEIDDLQDPVVSQVQWSTDKLGEIGSGRRIQTDRLRVGTNLVTVTATNSLGASASARVTVHVGDRLVPPSATLSVSPQAIAWHIADDDVSAQSADLRVENSGGDNLGFNLTSDQPWLRVDSATTINGVIAPRTFTVTADPSALPAGVTSRANITLSNLSNAADVVSVPVELSRGNVFDRTGQAPGPCAGDCDGDGTVNVAELIRAVNIALDALPISQCTAVDADGNGSVTIDELVRAVGSALQGC